MTRLFKIDKSNVEEILSLSPMQEGMLFHYLKDPDSEQYFEQLSLSISGEINMRVFEKAWNFVTSKNEMLRTLFRWEKLDKPVQIILKKHNTKIITHDFCCDDISESIRKLCDTKIENKSNKFDLREVPFRVTLCKLEKSQYEMIVTNHHILYDGWSTGVILQDFLYAYDALGKNQILEKTEIFRVKESIKYINDKNKELEQLYWEEYLKDFEGENLIQMRLEEISVRKLEQYTFDISQDFITEIDSFTKDKKMTLAELMYCAWGILIQKYTNSRDIAFGTTVSGRNSKIRGIENAVGLFINTLPLRIKSNGEKSISQLFEDIKESVREREPYEATALVDIKKYSGMNGEKDLFDSLVVVENYPLDNLLNKKERLLDIVAYSIEEQTNYPLTLSINRSEYLKLTLTYDMGLMSKEYVRNMSEHFINILKFIIKESEKSISEINILTEREIDTILYEFNNTEADYPKDKTIQELFEEQVEKTPNNIAVIFEDEELTYKELNEKTNSLARVLRFKGVKPDSIVGVILERSPEMIIGIMAILKAGGAYLPIDPNYPKERIEYMLKDSESHILLGTEGLLDNIEFDREIIDLFNEELFKGNSSNLEKVNNSSDLAYVIYTSGTTGKPKGTLIEHKALVNRLNWMQKKYPLSEEDVLLQKTTYTFDVSVWEILWWSLVGAKLYMLAPKDEKDPIKIIKAISKYSITVMHFVPSMLDIFLCCLEEGAKITNLPSLRRVFCSGEILNFKQVSKFYKEFGLSKNLINLYGPTEATIDVSYFECDNNDRKVIPIGKPIDNIKLYILNDNEILPIGVPGELYIAGDGLARGYLNRVELTAEKFIDNSFSPGTKMYKTGDLAKWLPDGNIEFLGRIDNQVKLRGFRIEIGEIINTLLKHEDIKEAAIEIKENKENDKYICAYVVSEKEINELNLKTYLKESLPEYMVPAYFVQIEKMPLTSSGKLDRRALPEPNKEVGINEYEAPRNEVEEKLSKVWSEVLGFERVGINDNFFELGGHSLKAMVIISKIHKELNRGIPLKELFKSPTIKELSKFIENAEENPYSKIEKVEEREYYEASSAQKRMYMLQQFEKDSIAYNMPVVFALDGQVDKERIEDVFRKLFIRHETLRTYFETVEGQIVQKIDNSYEFKLVDRKDYGKIENITNKFVRSFELEKAPLFRAEIVESSEKTYLLIDMHHIISDGVSMSILIKEFTALYKGESLEALILQYKDFAAWQNNFLKSEDMKNQEEYWVNRFNDETPVLNLPYDYERPAMQSFEGDSISFEVDKKTTEELRKLAKETGTTMYMILLSAFNILLSKYSGQEDLVVGTPIVGRPHADIQNIIGMFVNTLALRNKPEGDKKYSEFLKEVRENSLKAYEYHSYQLETLVEKLDVRRDTSRNPLFDVMFNMSDAASIDDIELDEFSLKLYNKKNKISKVDLTLNVQENSRTLEFKLEYCTKIFKKETIERLRNHYIKLLGDITNNIEIKISEIQLLAEKEKNQILYEFNDTKVDYPKNKTIQELFEEQVEKTPDNIAVIYDNQKITYKELDEKSNQIACALREKGVKREVLVGIMFERSIDMIATIIGILKAGGAYVPIDAGYPINRIKAILSDSKAKYLITKSNFIVNKTDFYFEIVSSTEVSYLIYLDNLDNLEEDNNLFRTFKLAESLTEFDDPQGNNDLTLYYNEKAMNFEVYMRKIEKLCEFFEINKLDINKKVGVMLSNPINKIIAIRSLKNANLLFEVIDTNKSIDEKIESIKNSSVQTIISDSDYIDEIDKFFWGIEQLNTYVILDSYNVHGSEKEEQLTSLWNIVADETTEEINDYGWQNSYNGERFSVEEMKEYIENFNVKLEPYINYNSRVLDIGCGHGLALFEIAPKVKEYLATDMSEVIIEKNKRRVQREKIANVKFRTLPACDISKLDAKGYDVVVCCSVIHYFPNTLYLEKVIKGAIDKLGDEGVVYLDDLMNTETKKELIDSVLEYKKNNSSALTKTDWSNDLFINSDFFEFLQNKYPEIVKVEITPKLGKIKNELTKFRYDVLLKINKKLKSKDEKKQINKSRYTADDILGYQECIEDNLNLNKTLKYGSADTNNYLTDFASVCDLNYLEKCSKEKVKVINNSSDISYVIYTSGSTGKPKGAIVEHVGMVNHIYAKINDLKLSKNSIIAQNASHCFDISVWQFFAALICGGKTIIYSNDLVINIEEFISGIIKDEVNILEVVPSFLEVIINHFEETKERFTKLKYLLVTGEELKVKLVKRWFDIYQDIRMVNAYGPTEASDDITHYIMDRCPNLSNIPIGKPVQNLKVYVVDECMNLCPIGVKGEIVVSGIGVGRGYLNDKEKTRKVFMEDPFRKGKNIRLYKTGDLGRWIDDGTIEFFGRKDYQVKIRGFRVELGEIESRLMECTDVKAAVVIDREDENGSKYLCAYIVSSGIIDTLRLKEELKNTLPENMIPSYFQQLEKLPLTPNGKIDRKALPEAEFEINTGAEYEAPRNELEEKITSIWKEVLGVERIGINDNFFDLGGHSLKATALIAKIHKQFDVEISLKELFKTSTIKEISKYVEGTEKNIYSSIKAIEEREYYPASSVQKRLYSLQLHDKESIAYNIPSIFELDGDIYMEKLRNAFEKLVDRHEILRTSLIQVNNEIMQKVHKSVQLNFDYTERFDDEIGNINELTEEFVKPFNLEDKSLLRIKLIKFNNCRYILMVDIHHIISDGTTMALIVKELVELYEGKVLESLKIQYKDYAEWQSRISASDNIKNQEKHWMDIFANGQLPILKLPYDFYRPSLQSFNGDSVEFVINKKLTERLKRIAKDTDSTLYIVLLTAYNILLSKYSGQEDIVVGTPISGRNQAELENVAGMFVNTLALRNYPNPDKTSLQLLIEVRNDFYKAFENSDFQFEDLIDKLNIKRDISRNPIFDVMFAFQNEDNNIKKITGFNIKELSLENKTSKFDLSLIAIENDELIKCRLEYCQELFNKNTIVRICEDYIKIINNMIEDLNIKICDISLLNLQEKVYIANEYNDLKTFEDIEFKF